MTPRRPRGGRSAAEAEAAERGLRGAWEGWAEAQRACGEARGGVEGVKGRETSGGDQSRGSQATGTSRGGGGSICDSPPRLRGPSQ